MFHVKTCLGSLVFAGIFTVAPAASAADTAPIVQNDEAAKRLHDIIADEAARQRRQRQAASGLAFGLSGLSAGLGVACLAVKSNDDDAFAQTVGGVGFEVIAGLGVVLAIVALAAPTPIEKLSREYDVVQRDPSRDHLAWAEEHLHELAERERRARVTAAVLAIAVAPLVSGAGIASALLLPSGTDPLLRVLYGGFFQVLALADVTVGVVRLLSLDPAESLWRTWTIGTGRSVQARSWFAPTLGGATAGVTLSF